MCKYIIFFHSLHEKCKVQDLAHMHVKILNSRISKMCKYQDIMFFYFQHARWKVQNLAHLHVQDFEFLHIENVQVPRHYVFSTPRCKGQSARSCTFVCPRFYILAHKKCARTKSFCFFHSLHTRCKVQHLAHLHV